MNIVISEPLVAELKRHEGYSDKLYKCTAGYNTIGYGWNVDAGIDKELADLVLRYQIDKTEKLLVKTFDWFSNLTQARKEVIINMVFNLGLDGFKGFRNTIRLIGDSRHEEAAMHMLNSKWARQVGTRARYLSDKFKAG